MTNNTSITERYKVIPRTLIFLFNESEVLLIKQNSETKPGFDKWNGIGGHVEEGENPYFAAKREINEESGLSIDNITLHFITIIPDTPNTGVCLFIFSGKSESKIIKESSEGKLCWIKMDYLNEFSLMDDLPRLLELVISQSANDCPQILSYSIDTKIIKIDIVE